MDNGTRGISLENSKVVNKISEITTKFYLKTRVKGVKKFSDIYNKIDDSYIELKGCQDMDDAVYMSRKLIYEILDTVDEVGNELIAYMVAKK